MENTNSRLNNLINSINNNKFQPNFGKSKSPKLRQKFTLYIKEIIDNHGDLFTLDLADFNQLIFIVSFTGLKDTLIESIKFTFEVSFPEDFPFKPPVFNLITPELFFHPNVSENGRIYIGCKDWSPAVNLTSLLYSVVLVFTDPDLDNAINYDALALYYSDRDTYNEIIKNSN